MPTTIDLSAFGPGTFTFEDDGIVGNNRSQVRDQNGNIVATFTHDQSGISVISGAGQHLVLNFTDSLGAANFTVGTSNDPPGTPGYVTPNPDSIEVNNIVSSGIVDLTANTISEFGSDAAADIVAGQLAIRATAGVGTNANALETQVSRLQGETITGGIFLDNSGDVIITSVNGRARGLMVQNSGDVHFTNHGTINLGSFGLSAQPIQAGSLSGDVVLTALGANADIIGGVQSTTTANHGNVVIFAGRDALLQAVVGASVSVQASRDLSLGGASVQNSTDSDILLTAGRNLTINEFGALSNPAGDIILTAGPGGLLSFGTAHSASATLAGDMIFNADRVAITPVGQGSNILAYTGAIIFQTVTAGRAIDLGSTTDNANALELSNAELDALTGQVIRVGNSTAGPITVTSGMFFRATAHLSLISGGDITFLANIGFATDPALGPTSIDVLAGNNFSASGVIFADGFTATVDAFGTDPGVGGVLTLGTLNASAPILFFGNEDNDTLNGTANAEQLNGRGGADTMRGFGGNDIYIVDNAGDQVIEAAGQGYDVVYASVSYSLAAGQEVEGLVALDYTATTALALTGNEFANYLMGNQGANQLNGAAGADAMQGLGGNDIYVVDNAGDLVIEAAGQGYDVVYTSVNYALAAGQEVEGLVALDYAGTTPLNLTGNEIANYLLGNAGANQLSGGAGADAMEGRGGADIYIVDNVADLVIETAGNGYDVVYTSVSYMLAAGQEVEGLVTSNFAGTGAINLTGNEIANYLIGNDGANVLNGGAGADTLHAGGGADTFAFTNAVGGNNVDYLDDFVHGTDKIALDDAIFGAGIGTPGSFNANAFVVGSQAGDADDRIIYNQATGQLFYDADGNGSGAAVLFANLNGAPVLSASDFVVI